MLSDANVISLDSHRQRNSNIAQRQAIVRQSIEDGRAASGGAVAYASVSITPQGETATTACLIEPEHVPAVVEALTGLIDRMQAFRAANAGKVTTAIAYAALASAVFYLDLSLVPALADTLTS